MKLDGVKDLFSVAVGPVAHGDKGWHAAGTQRLFFSDPKEIGSEGMVDVHVEGDEVRSRVRVELWVAPEIAAEVISHVTGTEVLTTRIIANRLVKEFIAATREEAEKVHGDGMELSSALLKLLEDDKRREEWLDERIAATGGLMARDEDEPEPKVKEETSEDEIARLAKEQEEDDDTNTVEVAMDVASVLERGPVHEAVTVTSIEETASVFGEEARTELDKAS